MDADCFLKLPASNIKGISHMLPFLHFHAIAAGRGDGLRPEFCALLEGSATSSGDVAVRPDGMLQAGPDPVSTKVRLSAVGAAAPLQPSLLLMRHLGADASETGSVLIDDAPGARSDVQHRHDAASTEPVSDQATKSTTDALPLRAPEGYGPADGRDGQLRFSTYS
jgi:hypothetical protein